MSVKTNEKSSTHSYFHHISNGVFYNNKFLTGVMISELHQSLFSQILYQPPVARCCVRINFLSQKNLSKKSPYYTNFFVIEVCNQIMRKAVDCAYFAATQEIT
jgi:hypothetical protein